MAGKKTKPASTLGSRLLEARKRKKLTQHALAKKVGCWVQEISDYERDNAVPGMARMLALASALGVTVESLAGSGETRATQ